MRRIFTIRLKGMNAAKAVHDLRATDDTSETIVTDEEHAKVREAYFGPTRLPDRDEGMRRVIRAENATRC